MKPEEGRQTVYSAVMLTLPRVHLLSVLQNVQH